MRERLVAAFVALTLAVVGVFLVERAYATSDLVRQQEQRKVERSADLIAAILGDTRTQVTPEILGDLLYTDEHAVYVDAEDGRVEADNHADAATAGEEHDSTDLTVTRDVAGGGTLTLIRHRSLIDARVADALLRLVLISLGLVAVAAAVGVLLARRLSRPFTDLAAVAVRVGQGDFAVEVPRSRVPEADQVGQALRTAAHDLDALVRRERDFAAHASHELRTPLTAARLELEDLAMAPHTPSQVVRRISDVLGQLERLSATVSGMLDASRASRVGTRVDIDLSALVRDAVVRWQALAPDRHIVAACEADVVPVRLPTGALLQVVDELVGNAVAHGSGTITVNLSAGPEYVELRVSDEGPRSAAAGERRQPVAPPGSGLARASEIAEALDGRLRLTDDPMTTFSLVLPHPDRETVTP